MAQARVVESIEASVEAVWTILGNFAGMGPGPGITAVSYDGEGVGMTRTIETPNGKIIERLETHDSDNHTFSYVILNDDSPLPFSGYRAEVTLAATGTGTQVTWVGTFEPKGVEEAKAVAIASGIYSGGIAGARKALT